MKKTKVIIDNIRHQIDQLEAETTCLPMTAKQVIDIYAGPSINVRTLIPLMALGDKDFEHRKFMARTAGVDLGLEIAKKLDFSMSREHQKDRYIGRSDPFTAEYVSTVYAFTPIELTKLIDEALRIGRQSA